MGNVQIQLLLADNTWSTRYNKPKNDRFIDSPTQCTKLSLGFTIQIYGIKLVCDQIDTPQADMCFSNIIMKHSVYQMDHINFFEALFESIPDYRKNSVINVFN